MSVLLNPDEFDNESVESFWTQQTGGTGGVIEEISTGSLRMHMRGDLSNNWNSANTGDRGTQLYQPVAYDQEFDVVVSCFVESDFYTKNYSNEMNFGLFWKRQDDVGDESAGEYFRIMARGDGNWATNYQYQGQAETETTAANFDQTDFYFRLTRSGTGGPMTMRSYYSLTGVSGSWTLHAEETSSQFRFAGWVGIGGTKDFQDTAVPCYTEYFRNYPATYKLAGTISHDGYLSLIPNESSLSDWGESPDTYPLTASGTWEIFTSFSGVVSVVGRRDSDDKVVGVGGLTPILVSSGTGP
jgi:hypothetical protein